ncbi:hypothetical protein [Chitinophaga sp. MD30]|nr:hypothetical protein [Chitinophaga sp. MD30]
METPFSVGDNRLLLVFHHLGIDGVSWRILLEDLSQLLSFEVIRSGAGW